MSLGYLGGRSPRFECSAAAKLKQAAVILVRAPLRHHGSRTDQNNLKTALQRHISEVKTQRKLQVAHVVCLASHLAKGGQVVGVSARATQVRVIECVEPLGPELEADRKSTRLN